MPAPTSSPLLIEVNLISAQDLHRSAAARRRMRTYAVAWVDPDNKLASRIDKAGGENPTWNDKFVFAIDERRLRSPTATLEIEIYRVCGWLGLRDERIGVARVLIEELLSGRDADGGGGALCAAFQVRRPSGRPQGIVNVGTMVLDGLPYEVMSRKLSGSVKRSAAEEQESNGAAEREGGCRSSSSFTIRAREKIHQWPSDGKIVINEQDLAEDISLRRSTKSLKQRKIPHYLACF